MCNLELKILNAIPENCLKIGCIELINNVRRTGEDATAVRAAVIALCQRHYLKPFDPTPSDDLPESVSITPLGRSAKRAQEEQNEAFEKQRTSQKRGEYLNLAVLLVSVLSLLVSVIALTR